MALLLLICLPGFLSGAGPSQGPEPVLYTIRFPDLEAQLAEIQVDLPTRGLAEVELRMPIWSPGFYRVQDYAGKIRALSAQGAAGEELLVSNPSPTRWRIGTGGADAIRVTYLLHCPDSFVTTNWVSPDLLVLNGPATYLAPQGLGDSPYEVFLEPAPTWKGVATGLDPDPNGYPNHFRADDYDTLVDSPIVAGDLTVTSFPVAGVPHLLVDVGDREGWDSERAAADLQRIVQQSLPLWGDLPYARYVFLNVFRRGGGGLEHGNSTLLTTGARAMATPSSYRGWLEFATHEYFHALNVKRLRPVELGPFDYQEPPTTPSLWLSEGVTSYVAGLLVARAGLSTPEEFLASLSAQIAKLQSSPGRLLQSLEQSSLEVWKNSNSGVEAAPTTVSYYVKGEVVGFLLDARIRSASGGEGSLEDMMRRAYQRYGGDRGFEPKELVATAEEVSGVPLQRWFHAVLATTEELDYSEALEWFGLSFAADGSWALELREDATGPQRAHLAALLAPSGSTLPDNSAGVEQTEMGTGPAPILVESFDGLGFGFQGPHGPSSGRNPSDNSLAVGPDHIVQTVNSRLAIFTREGERFDTTGAVLYGAVPTNTVFHGFGGTCEERNNGDAVVRYDQLADRWLLVMPIFRRGEPRPDQPDPWVGADSVYLSPPGVNGQPGRAAPLFVPEPWVPPDSSEQPGVGARRPAGGRGEGPPPEPQGVYSMCYAVSVSSDPLGSWYRYEFLRPLFPDYPRPAIWTDGYYVPTSTGDDIVQKHACVVDRDRMLSGEPATEQCFVLDGVNFLNNADVDGRTLPPPGAPNIMMATGGTQLDSIFSDDEIFAWRFHVDWEDPGRSRVVGPEEIPVAPYRYLCDGQLSRCVPQPDTDQRLDSQGDKIMSRLVYRRLEDREAVVAVHSVATSGGGGGVRWYELSVDADRSLRLRQQGTFLDDGLYRWMASPAMDRFGNIALGYSFGGPGHFPGQRLTGRLAGDPLGGLTLRETVLVEGEAAQTNTLRWEDYTTTAMDPRDDCTVWYVGDYLKAGAEQYSTRIGAIRMPGCVGGDGR